MDENASSKQHRQIMAINILLAVLTALTLIFTATGPLSQSTLDSIPQRAGQILGKIISLLTSYGWVFPILWVASWQRSRLLVAYGKTLSLILRPVLQTRIEQSVDQPFEIKTGELEFVMAQGQTYRQEKFIFDKPFRETPNVFISESTGGDWLFVKIDAKDVQSFTWAANRSVFPQAPSRYSVRLQWIAVAPNFSMKNSGTEQLVINRATYSEGTIAAVLTSQLRSRVANDAVDVVCGNDIGGDPKNGSGKTLTVDYTFRGQRKSVIIPEGGSIKLP